MHDGAFDAVIPEAPVWRARHHTVHRLVGELPQLLAHVAHDDPHAHGFLRWPTLPRFLRRLSRATRLRTRRLLMAFSACPRCALSRLLCLRAFDRLRPPLTAGS